MLSCGLLKVFPLSDLSAIPITHISVKSLCKYIIWNSKKWETELDLDIHAKRKIGKL